VNDIPFFIVVIRGKMIAKIVRNLLVFLFAFGLGIICTSLFSNVAEGGLSMPLASPVSDEVPSPQDWIQEEDIWVYNNKVVINIKDPEWAGFSDTNSMDPVIDAGSNAIEIIPKNPSQIEVGDIVSYESEYTDGTIIHRVIERGIDSEGAYFILKGDNNPTADPGKVRFSQIRRVLVAIIY